jgi:hypothetical protein
MATGDFVMPHAALDRASPDTLMPRASPQDDHAILLELNRNYVRSAQQSDVDWYDQHLDAGFMASNPDGSLVDRAAFLRRMTRSARGSAYDAVHVRIRLIGELGIIHAGFRYTRPDGTEHTGCYTNTWSRHSGRWLCVAAHFALD